MYFALALASTGAHGQTGQTIYKCTAQGKVSYGQAPCTTGHAIALDPVALPDTAAADQQTRLLHQQAQQLTRERHRREADDERMQQRAAHAAATVRANCARLKLQQRWADEDAAHARHKGQAALKARRAGEKLALACPQ